MRRCSSKEDRSVVRCEEDLSFLWLGTITEVCILTANEITVALPRGTRGPILDTTSTTCDLGNLLEACTTPNASV